MDNIEKIKKAVKDSDIDALMISGQYNRRYATGFPSSDGMAVITDSEAWFFTDSRYAEAAGNAIKNCEIMTVSRQQDYIDFTNRVLEGRAQRLGFEENIVTWAEYDRFSRGLNQQLVPAESILNELRAVKSPEELEIMKKAQSVAEEAFNQTLSVFKRGMTEKELAAELTSRMLKLGGSDKSFDPIVVSAERSSMPHGVPTDKVISDGFLTMDFGILWDGYCSDTTRTVCVGEPTDEMLEVYDTVLRAQLKGIETARAGIAAREIHGAAADIIAGAGYGEYFGHGFGHGLGLEVHEAPSVNRVGDYIMRPGNVISAEPGIYLPGKFGVRIEDVVYITETGCVNITGLTKELVII